MASTSVPSGSPVIPAAAALYFSLEDAASRGLSHDELAKLLDESADFLCGCLGSYKPPCARSKAEVESGSVRYGGETRSLNASIREVTVAASKKLNLDEVQTYALLRRCLAEDGAPSPASLDDDLAERLTTYYFRERLSVLKCVHALLMHAQAEEEDRAAEVMTATLESMLGKGLEANLVDGACAHLLGETPARPEDARKNPSVSKDWSELALEETRVMLECVFLMYYDRRTTCASATFARLARAFERGALGGAPAAAAELVRYAQQMGGTSGAAGAIAQVRVTSDSLRALCAVILVEALNLEGAVDRIQKPGAFEEAHAMLSEGALSEAAEALESWPSDAAHGPVLLAWATLLALAPAASADRPGVALPAAADPAAAVARAAGGDAGYGSLLALLRLEQLKGAGGINATLHKSVLKNLLSSSLAAFDILPVHKLRAEELASLLDVLEELTSAGPRCASSSGAARVSARPRSAAVRAFGRVSGKAPRGRAPAQGARRARRGAESGGVRAGVSENLPAVALPRRVPSTPPPARWCPWTRTARRAASGSTRWCAGARRATGRGRAPAAAAARAGGRGGGPASAHLPGACVPARRGRLAAARARLLGARRRRRDARRRGRRRDAVLESSDIVTWSAPADGTRVLVARLCVLSVAGMAPDGASAADAAELDVAPVPDARPALGAVLRRRARGVRRLRGGAPGRARDGARRARRGGHGSTSDGAAWATRAVAGAESR